MDCFEPSRQMGSPQDSRKTFQTERAWKTLNNGAVYASLGWYLLVLFRFFAMFILKFFPMDEMIWRKVWIVTGIWMGVLTAKLLALFLYRIWWIKKTRKKLRMQPRRKNPLRWFSMIPVTLLLDILFVVWGCYQDAFFWERQYERLLAEGELGHGLPLISVLCVLFAGAVTAGITVLSVILVCISRYRSRYER